MSSISFSEFSPLFISQILGSAVVESWLSEIVGDNVIHFQHLGSEGTATLSLGQISRKVGDCEVTFDVPLALQLKFSIPLLAESYEGPAELHLFLKAEIYEPALLYLKARRVREEDIQIDPGLTAGLGLAQALGSQWDLFNVAVKRKIRSEIDGRLRGTRSARLIDLSALAFESLIADPRPRPADKPGDTPGLAPARVTCTDELEPGSMHTYSTPVGAGERARFIIYTATDVDGLEAHGGFEIFQAGAARPIEHRDITTEGAWLGDYRRHECSFQAEEAGVYTLRISNCEQSPERCFYYTIRQERTKPELGDPICFAAYGPDLMRHLLSPALLEYKLKTLIPKTSHFGPLSLLGVTSVEGDADIQVLSVVRDGPKRRMEDRELAFRVLLRIAPTVSIGLLHLAEKWRIETRATIRVRVHAVASPLSIQIDPDEVALSAVEVVESKCVEGEGRFDAWKMLSRSIALPLVNQMKQIMDETEFERTIDIESLARQAAPPAESSGPVRVRELAGRLQIQKSIEGVIGAGQVPHYVALALRKGRRLDLDLAWFLPDRPAHPFEATLAVCDGFRGVMESRRFTVGEAGKSDTTGLSFTAPQTGAYCFRVRIEPSETARDARLEYRLQVRVS